MFNFKNTYSELPGHFYHKINPQAHTNPKLIIFNKDLARRLNLDHSSCSEDELANYLTGKKLSETSNPIALGYAGHQFGNFVPQLGDGRAVLLGEAEVGNELFDIQLKGSGRTRYSRRGDGRCSLGPAIREYLVSKYMKNIDIPTTESLAVCLTGESVQREEILPGAVVARVAKGHIRVGTFEYYYYQQDFESLKILADYAIKRFFPSIEAQENKYLKFFQEVAKSQLFLVAKWMSVGFIHGVMNTDNTSISGETIDYGPCAFMDTFESEKVFSSIDIYKRYSYSNQSHIVMWNLSSLANCLAALISDQAKAIESFEYELSKLPDAFEKLWLKEMSKKFGILDANESDKEIVHGFLNYLEENKLDFTQSFRALPAKLDSKIEIYTKIRKRLKKQNEDIQIAIDLMNSSNPEIIARNHHIEEAIVKSYQGDYSLVHKLAKAYASPFNLPLKDKNLSDAPTSQQEVKRTFCGT